jgi:hypothetical protein
MSDALQKKINSLPQVLQNLIGEYNVEHRNYTKMLHCEFYDIITIKCCNCNYININEFFYSVDYFMNKKYNIRSKWCSDECFQSFGSYSENNKMIIEKYTKSVNKYMGEDTIQYEKGKEISYF